MTIDEDAEETQLHIAARLSNVELVRAALREGFDANAVGISGWTPVHEAASSGDCAILRLLLRSGGDPNIQDRLEKCTSLHLAARNGHLDAVRLLVRNGARLDLKNEERRTAQEVAEGDDCTEYLDTKRLEGVVRQGPSDFRNSGERTVQKLYKKPRQNPSSQHSTPVLESRDSVMSSSSGESLNSGSTGSCDQDPYDIGLSFDFNKQYLSLKIHIGHVKNLKLPAGHNYSHLYVKSYLVPCKSQSATKRKTSQLKIDSNGRQSSGSSGAESIDSTDSGIGLEEKMTRMVMSSLKKRPSLSPKKKQKSKDKVKCMVQQDTLEGICRVSAVFEEDLMYDTVTLSKVNLAVCEIVISVCGRNSWTSSGQPIVSVRIPLSSATEQVTHKDFPVKYHMTEQPSRVGRRNLGWDAPADLSQSVPNLAPAAEQGFSYRASTNDIYRKSKKHSPFKFLKSDLRLTKGSTNDRYKKKSRRESSTTASLNDSGSGDWNRSFGSSPTTTTPTRPRDAENKSGQDKLDRSDEVMAFHIPEPSLADKYRECEDEVPRAHFLRYSRAFQQRSSKRDDSDAISVEDLDDSPYAVQEKFNTRMATRTRLNVA